MGLCGSCDGGGVLDGVDARTGHFATDLGDRGAAAHELKGKEFISRFNGRDT